MKIDQRSDSGRAQQLTQWVERYQKPLLNLCYMDLGDRVLAEDAVQETFLKAYRNAASFRGECSEKTWLMRIAVNTCRDMKRSAWFRHVNRRVTPDELPEGMDTASDQAALDLGDAIIRLPEAYKVVILLYYYQDMTLGEIAAIVGVTPSVVSRRIKKACAQLQNALGKEYLYE